MNRIKELKPPFSYDDYSQSVINADGDKVLNVQYLKNPDEPQDAFGKIVADFLNEKLLNEKAENET